MRKIVYVIGIISLLFGGHYIFKAAKVKNVFDEMYYADVQPIPKIYTTTSFQPLVVAKVLENIPDNVKKNYARNINLESYLEKALQGNESLDIYFDKNREELTAIGALNYSKDSNESEALQVIYTYQMKSKKVTETIAVLSEEYPETDYRTSELKEIEKFMEAHDLTKEDLTYYREYFLYEKLLADWFAHNPKSRFSLDDLGDVKVVETNLYVE